MKMHALLTRTHKKTTHKTQHNTPHTTPHHTRKYETIRGTIQKRRETIKNSPLSVISL